MNARDAAQAPSTVSGTLFVGSRDARGLFDTGATHTIVSFAFAKYLGVAPRELMPPFCISTPVGVFVHIPFEYPSVSVKIGDRDLLATLLPI